jgi:hypothetical protein
MCSSWPISALDLPSPIAQQGDHRVEVFERLVCAGADHGGGARDLFGRCLRAELERTGMQAQQRDPVGEDVVHLPRNTCALAVADLFDAQLLLGLSAAPAFAPRLATPTHDHSRCDDRHRGERGDDKLGHRLVGLDDLLDRRHRELQPGDEERLLPGAVRGSGEQDDRAGRSGGGRDRDYGRRGQPEHERPAPPAPQGEAQRRPADHVEHEQRRCKPAVDGVGQLPATDRDRQQEQCAVDYPVTPGPGCGRRLVLRDAQHAEAKASSPHDAQARPRRRG